MDINWNKLNIFLNAPKIVYNIIKNINNMNIPVELFLYNIIKKGIGFAKIAQIILNKTPIIPWNIRTKNGSRKL